MLWLPLTNDGIVVVSIVGTGNKKEDNEGESGELVIVDDIDEFEDIVTLYASRTGILIAAALNQAPDANSDGKNCRLLNCANRGCLTVA